MSRVLACRVCLASDLNMYPIPDTPFQAIYEKLTSKKLVTDDARPVCLCYICLHQLQKCNLFVEKSLKADELLTQIADNDIGMTKESIKKVDKNFYNLESPYKITPIEYVDIEDTVIQAQEINNKTITQIQGDTETPVLPWSQEAQTQNAPWTQNVSQTQDVSQMQNVSQTQNVSWTQNVPWTQVKSEPQDVEQENMNFDSTTSVGDNGVHRFNLNDTVTETRCIEIEIKIKEEIEDTNDDSSKRQLNTVEVKGAGGADANFAFTDTPAGPNTKFGQKKTLYKCEYCSYSSHHNSTFTRHVRRHTGEKPYKCEYCSYTSTQSSCLKRHIRNHTGEKPYKCEHCGHSFNQKVNMLLHMRTHTGEKPYKCEHCSYSCKQKGNLTTHLRIHSAERPYKCEICSFTSKTKTNLMTHTRRHLGEIRHTCDHCGFSCVDKRTLINHMYRHMEKKTYTCKYCGHISNGRGASMKHLRKHKGEKTYKCEKCSFSCSDRHNLFSHMKTHLGGKPYKCEYCSYSCVKETTFRSHLKTHPVLEPSE